MAGFFDGEGHLGMRINKDKRTGKFSICVKFCVVNTNKKIIEELSLLFKCKLLERSNGGKNLVLYEIKIENVRGIKKALEHIFDFLVVKKQKAKIMLEYCDSRIKNFSKRYIDNELELVKEFQSTT